MKKIKWLLLICLCLIPSVAKAGGMVEGFPCKVKVSNVNGAIVTGKVLENDKYIEKAIVVPYDTVLEIYLLDHQITDRNGKDYDGFYISLSDVTGAPYNIADYYHDEAKTFITFDATYLYEGPSHLYTKISDKTLDKGYQFTTHYYAYGTEVLLWAYVEEKQGWVFTMSGSEPEKIGLEPGVVLGIKKGGGSVITWEETKMLENPNSRNVVGVIPAKTEVTTDIYYAFNRAWCGNTYVKYNGVSGYIGIDSTFWKVDHNYEVKDKDCNLYDSMNDNKKVIATIPAGTIIDQVYEGCDMDLIMVRYNGQIGYIDSYAEEGQHEKQNESNTDKPIEVKESKKLDAKDIIIISSISVACLLVFAYIMIRAAKKNEFK